MRLVSISGSKSRATGMGGEGNPIINPVVSKVKIFSNSATSHSRLLVALDRKTRPTVDTVF